MIAIINKSPKYGFGFQSYELFVNRKKIVTFAHKFEEGMATCLRCAADAVEKMEKERARSENRAQKEKS